MMITRIQYWKRPLAMESAIMIPAYISTMRSAAPCVRESTPPRIASGSSAPKTSLRISAPKPSNIPLRYRQTYGESCRKTLRIGWAATLLLVVSTKLFRALLIDMADGFQALEHALDVGFVFGQEQRVARRRGLFAVLGLGGNFAPELAIRHTVDESFAREAAEMAQKAVGCIGIAGVHQQELRFVGKCELHDQWKRRAPIEPADLRPWKHLAGELQMRLMDFDGRTQREIQNHRGASEEESRRDPRIRPSKSDECGEDGENQRDQSSPEVVPRRPVAGDSNLHTTSLAPCAPHVKRACRRCALRGYSRPRTMVESRSFPNSRRAIAAHELEGS